MFPYAFLVQSIKKKHQRFEKLLSLTFIKPPFLSYFLMYASHINHTLRNNTKFECNPQSSSSEEQRIKNVSSGMDARVWSINPQWSGCTHLLPYRRNDPVIIVSQFVFGAQWSFQRKLSGKSPEIAMFLGTAQHYCSSHNISDVIASNLSLGLNIHHSANLLMCFNFIGAFCASYH